MIPNDIAIAILIAGGSLLIGLALSMIKSFIDNRKEKVEEWIKKKLLKN